MRVIHHLANRSFRNARIWGLPHNIQYSIIWVKFIIFIYICIYIGYRVIYTYIYINHVYYIWYDVLRDLFINKIITLNSLNDSTYLHFPENQQQTILGWIPLTKLQLVSIWYLFLMVSLRMTSSLSFNSFADCCEGLNILHNTWGVKTTMHSLTIEKHVEYSKYQVMASKLCTKHFCTFMIVWIFRCAWKQLLSTVK